jgi:hypothetical protein
MDIRQLQYLVALALECAKITDPPAVSRRS